ncbi:ubiquitin-conjugating enzyme/RWD-like protein, partial [Baffinella frigidus]
QGDILDWQFVLLGAEDSPFAKGLYHGRIQLDSDYPMKPPRILFLTESGRFEVNVPVCLSITSHHAECWQQPTWDIRTALTAIRSFMETPAGGAIGALD